MVRNAKKPYSKRVNWGERKRNKARGDDSETWNADKRVEMARIITEDRPGSKKLMRGGNSSVTIRLLDAIDLNSKVERATSTKREIKGGTKERKEGKTSVCQNTKIKCEGGVPYTSSRPVNGERKRTTNDDVGTRPRRQPEIERNRKKPGPNKSSERSTKKKKALRGEEDN